ncbi:MAG: hypothetical protein ACI9MB_001202 [Verrucomicrobiales bacterium]|jgi:hypothetical protein
MVTELIRMQGSQKLGGPGGFGLASQNDVPMAAKGLVISSAFLGVEMKCARCHDAPSHKSLQKDLFELAALLSRKPVTVPKPSSVSLESLSKGGRKPLIEVTLKPGSSVAPAWPFKEFINPGIGPQLAEPPLRHPRPPRSPHHRPPKRTLRPGHGQPSLATTHGTQPRRVPR